METPLFSVVLICRNEAKTIPKLLGSLDEFKLRGGEVILVDTGSTDNSVSVAREHGCRVQEVGERFLFTIDASLARKINHAYVAEGEAPVVKEGDRLFDYASARNYAAALSNTDVVAMPDCDEQYTRLDLDKIDDAIRRGVEQLEYEFVFAHDEFGNEAIKFRHCKFYDRRKLKWTGIVHEVLTGSATREYFGPDVIKLEHWQIPSEHRSRYLTGLALDCFLNPQNDRNSHYLAREMLFTGRPASALREFQRHLTLSGWPAEAAQSRIFCGDALMMLGREQKAVEAWQDAINHDGSRREAWIRLAEHYHRKNDPQRAASYAAAALTIPWSDFYANRVEEYRHKPHAILYWALWWIGDRAGSFQHWQKAKEFSPADPKFMADSVFYLDQINPKVSIVIPTLGREERLKALLERIPEVAGWANLEVIVIQDSFENRMGVPRALKAGVEKSTGEYVLFLGNDCLPEKNFVRFALEAMFKSFPQADGLVGLNDGIWQGELATHWMASKKLLPALDGEFFHTGYNHAGCDNELTGRCRKLGRYVWCKESMIGHQHPVKTGWDNLDPVYQLAYQPDHLRADRALLAERAAKLGFEMV